MNTQPKPELTRAFRQWQLRQKSDGSMVSIMALITTLPVVNFLASPGVGSAMFLGLFLFALGTACRRFFVSTAKVVAIRNTAGWGHSETQVNANVLDAECKQRPLPLDHWSTGKEHLN
jgi:Na+/H+ antiporter NhaB